MKDESSYIAVLVTVILVSFGLFAFMGDEQKGQVRYDLRDKSVTVLPPEQASGGYPIVVDGSGNVVRLEVVKAALEQRDQVALAIAQGVRITADDLKRLKAQVRQLKREVRE